MHPSSDADAVDAGDHDPSLMQGSAKAPNEERQPSLAPPGELIAERYRVEATIGRGGMGAVYRVFDPVRNERLALKRLVLSTNNIPLAAARTALFEREYHTLAQLRHPQIVAVYDYGVDGRGPHYTMELLEGTDLKRRVPVPWRELCALLRDIASALALLHSRKLVHRDVTPGNIHCTGEGRAKLFDFGAMAPMQVVKELVGTPPFVPPEAVLGQALDGRADLFALGATAYWCLTGQHAYPARSVSDLMDAWRSPPRSVAALNAEVPEALSVLLMSLLSLERVARPSSAAEVMERLEAIANLPADEHLTVAQAYLSAPTLVGREDALSQIRRKYSRLPRGKGSSILVESAAGVGRSRFLDACVLEAKLLGITVLRADALESSGDYGAARTLASQLLVAAPEAARTAALSKLGLLGHVMPELLPQFDNTVSLERFDDPSALRPRLQAALASWFLEVARDCRLLIAVDDVHGIDEPSVALVAALANQASQYPLLVLTTAETGAKATSPTALRLLVQSGSRQKLGPLNAEQTRGLLGSVFGAVANLEGVAARIYELSEGNPRACMELSQHLVDRGTARYSAGRWTLPERLDANDLPPSLAEAFAGRLAALGKTARALAEALAVGSEDALLSVDFPHLLPDATSSGISAALAELRASGVVRGEADRPQLTHQAWVKVLEPALSDQRRRELHRALATVLAARGGDLAFVTRHLFEAGDDAAALDQLLDGLKPIDRPRTRPVGYMGTLERALEASLRLRRSRRERILIEIEFIRMAAYEPCTRDAYILHERSVFAELKRDAGLLRWESLEGALAPAERLSLALRDTQQAYAESSERERGLPPPEAIRELGILASTVAGFGISFFDSTVLDLIPSLAPLVPLSAGLKLAEAIVDIQRDSIVGRYELGVLKYGSVLSQLAAKDRAGLEPRAHRHTESACVYGIGAIEAIEGLPAALNHADRLDTDPQHQGSARRLRGLYYLQQGNTQQAEACFQEMELLLIQGGGVQMYGGSTVGGAVELLTISGDLMGVKARLDAIAAYATRFPGWEPWLRFARGAYQRLRDDHAAALTEFEEGLSMITPGRHPGWAVLAGACIESLVDLGRNEEAAARGREWDAIARGERLCLYRARISRPLALAEARLGEHERAIALIEEQVREYEQWQVTGIRLGQLAEAGARIAIWMKDPVRFEHYSKKCEGNFGLGKSPGLTARFHMLLDQARRAGVTEAGAENDESSQDQSSADISQLLSTTFSQCRGPAERAEHTLQLLVQRSHAAGGFLYVIGTEGPTLSATHDNEVPPAELDQWVRDFIRSEVARSDDATGELVIEDLNSPTTSTTTSTSVWTSFKGHRLRPALLLGNRSGKEVMLAVAVLREQPQEALRVPWTLVQAISDALVDSGDFRAG